MRIACIPQQSAILVADLHQNEIIEPVSEMSGQRLLVIQADADSPQIQRILNGTVEGLFLQNTRFHRLDAKKLYTSLHQLLTQERGFFEAVPDSTPSTAYHAFCILDNRLYLLLADASQEFHVLRSEKLLAFCLKPQEFIALQPGDLIILFKHEAVQRLAAKNGLLRIKHAFGRENFRGTSVRKVLEKLGRLFDLPFIAVQVADASFPARLLPTQVYKNRWLLLLFLLFWSIAFGAAQCLNGN